MPKPQPHRLAKVRTEQNFEKEVDEELRLAMGLLEGEEWAVSKVGEMLSPEIALNKPPKTAGLRVNFQWRNSASKKLSAGRPLLSLDGIPIHSHPELQLSDVKHLPEKSLSPRKQKSREEMKRAQTMRKNQVFMQPRRTLSGHSVAPGRAQSDASTDLKKVGEEGGGKGAEQHGEGKDGKGYLPSVVKFHEGGKGASPTRTSPSRHAAAASSSSPSKLNTPQGSAGGASPSKERALSPIKVRC